IASKTDPVLGLLTNLVMRHGLLHRARKTVAECLLYIQSQTHSDPLPFVKEAIRRASPSVRVVSHKRGAKIIRVPLPLSERQRTRTGIMWILEAAEKR
ncbi:ribosomal protein S7, partial [Dacryopinax primogenitus]